MPYFFVTVADCSGQTALRRRGERVCISLQGDYSSDYPDKMAAPHFYCSHIACVKELKSSTFFLSVEKDPAKNNLEMASRQRRRLRLQKLSSARQMNCRVRQNPSLTIILSLFFACMTISISVSCSKSKSLLLSPVLLLPSLLFQLGNGCASQPNGHTRWG